VNKKIRRSKGEVSTPSRSSDLLADLKHMVPRCPPAAWEAYLLVGVFPVGERLRWCKVHQFVGRARPRWHCVSAVEALDGPGETVVLVGGASGVRKHPRGADAPRLEWGPAPETHLVLEEPQVEATARVRELGWWARIPRVLSYATGFGDLAWKDEQGTVRGVGLVEHAWGAAVPVDVAALAPRRWQWDVLALEGGGTMASLTLGGVGVRVMGRAGEGEAFATGWRARVRVREWKEAEGRSVPVRWEGSMTTRAGTLRYEARASTPVAAMVPGGGFLGSSWEGTWRGRPVKGTGFSEYRATQ
jgi:hypothetical protein